MRVLFFYALLIGLHACMSRDKASSNDVKAVVSEKADPSSGDLDLAETQQLDALLNELEADEAKSEPEASQSAILDPKESMPCILCLLQGMSEDTYGGFLLPSNQGKYSPSQLAYGNFLKHVAQNALRWVGQPESKVRREPSLGSEIVRDAQLGESVVILAIQGDFAKIGDREYIELSNLQIRPIGGALDEWMPEY